ncbi:hypothetical protein L873DRAFT_1840274 [Choiromyces venosus 120613-1]|uniref:FAD-binding PCMH-type domain-containing protein n=1 Tax=Choiromyces venosus 120613-1 TaxID=1336337 RepID=A0A3N4K2J1_9PEZI|nr:hypothetical protein L873DRAFT_1840274 [Choiromyces venosus 120613-1]
MHNPPLIPTLQLLHLPLELILPAYPLPLHNPVYPPDVIKTLTYTHAHSIPVLICNPGHSHSTSPSRFTQGVQVNIGNLNSIYVDAGANVMTIGGGGSDGGGSHGISESRKRNHDGVLQLRGVCRRRGGRGDMGRLQGLHGLIADNFLSVELVFWNGGIVLVSAEDVGTKGIRGTGHNLGVTTSAEKIKIYDIPSSSSSSSAEAEEGRTWTTSTLTFPPTNLSPTLSLLNSQIPILPAGTNHVPTNPLHSLIPSLPFRIYPPLLPTTLPPPLTYTKAPPPRQP